MAKKKSKLPDRKQGIKLLKVSKLKKKDLSKINLEDLWVIDPTQAPPKLKARLCRCRSVCLA